VTAGRLGHCTATVKAPGGREASEKRLMRSIVHRELGDPAQMLRLERAGLFDVAGYYGPSRIAEAVAHVGQPGKIGVVLLDFSENGEGK
jgi:hypothetical protein